MVHYERLTMATTLNSILIIEDDAALRDAYATVLNAEGYQTATADDGEEGLALARAHEPNVILLDMLMPNLNGIDFLRLLKPKENYPNTKIIVFSNMSVPSDVQDAMELGATKYLTKSSFTPKEIEQIIKDVLAGE